MPTDWLINLFSFKKNNYIIMTSDFRKGSKAPGGAKGQLTFNAQRVITEKTVVNVV